MKKIITSFSILLLCACSAKLALLTQADADRGSAKFSGSTLASLNEGKAHYEQYCGSCHGLKRPTSESEGEWNKIVPDMVKKANKKAGSEVVDTKKQELILHYVVTMSAAK
jgi:cytochrome c553